MEPVGISELIFNTLKLHHNMKKILLLLLTIITLQVQGQTVITKGDTTYYPRLGPGGVVYRQAAFAVVKPPDYPIPGKVYPVILEIPGMGDRSEGYYENLLNVLQGYDYDGNGPLPRQYPVMQPDFYTAIKTKQVLGVIVTYPREFNPADINFVLDELEKNWQVDKSREAIRGFSLGGGAVMRYITSSLANAKRLCLAVAVAPVSWASNLQYIVDAKLPFIGVTNRTDDRVSPEIIKNYVKAIEALNPAVAPKLLVFPQDGHGGINEMQALSHPYVPQSVYDYVLASDRANPKSYPLTVATIPTQPVPTDPSPTGLTAVAKEIGITTSSSITLDGSASTGASGHSWGVISVPAGVSIYTNLFTKGSGWHTVTASLPKEGAYTFVLNAYNSIATARDTIVVSFQKTSVPVPPTPVTYDSETGYLVFSDGSRVKATATIDWITKKVIVRAEDGISYSL
jgi:dienelactone hydrolase